MKSVIFYRNIFPEVSVEELLALIPFEQHSVRVYGAVHPQPRLTKWYGKVPYSYSGVTLEPCPKPPLLDAIRHKVESLVNASFNSVLANLYRNGSDTVGWHADDEPLFGPDPEVASVSFGATRAFKLRRNQDQFKITYDLDHGSVLFMPKGTQLEWKHTLPRTQKPIGARVNLTFRQTIA